MKGKIYNNNNKRKEKRITLIKTIENQKNPSNHNDGTKKIH
mgnify:CR=1 FL=1